MTLTFSIISLVFSLNLLLCLAFGPQNYLSLQYGNLSVRDYDQNNLVLMIPCTAYIGSCSFQFLSYPADWKATPQGEIVVPKKYANVTAFYSVKVNVSEPTGQSIDYNLIFESDKGKFTFQNSQQFYTKLQYVPKENPVSINSSIVKKLPSGSEKVGPFPSYNEVTEILESDNFLKIALLLSTILQTDAKCTTKRPYLQGVSLLIENQRAKNAVKIYFKLTEIKQIESMLQKLKTQRSVLAQKFIEQRKKINKNQILELQKNLSQSFYEYLSYSVIATDYENKLKEAYILSNETGNSQDEEYGLLEMEINALIDQIKLKQIQISKLFAEKYQMEVDLIQKQFQLQTKNYGLVKIENFSQYQKKFRQYSLKAAQSKMKYQNAQFQIQNIQSDAQLRQNALNGVDKEIQSIEQSLAKAKNSTEAKKAQQLQDVNLILQNNEKGLSKAINNLICT